MSELLERTMQDKRAMRRRLAALPFGHKLRLLEELRDRSRCLASNPLRRRDLPADVQARRQSPH